MITINNNDKSDDDDDNGNASKNSLNNALACVLAHPDRRSSSSSSSSSTRRRCSSRSSSSSSSSSSRRRRSSSSSGRSGTSRSGRSSRSGSAIVRGQSMEWVSESGTAALRVWQTSGNQVAAIPLEVMWQMNDVRALKKRLQGLCGLPSFRQQLLHDGAVLDDETKLARLELPVDLQLVLLSFGSGSLKQRNDFSFAVARGRTSEVQRMLQIPQDPNLADEVGETPLLVATKHGHVEVALLLLEAGADVNLPNRRGWTALTPLICRGARGFRAFVVGGWS